MLEEVEEAQEEMESLREDMKALWGKIREVADEVLKKEVGKK